MSLYAYLESRYAKAKDYVGRCVKRLISLAEKYPQIKAMDENGLYDLRWGRLEKLGLPDDFPVEPHMRSYVCEELTQSYKNYIRDLRWKEFLANGGRVPVYRALDDPFDS